MLSSIHRSKGFGVVILVSFVARFVAGWVAVGFEGNFPPMLESLEPYQDYKYLYLKDVERFLEGQMLYRDFHNAYPPLWIYTLAAAVRISHSFWSAATPLLLFDALVAPMVYLIARRIVDARASTIIGLLVALSPAALWWNGIFWLNPPPSTFFLILAAYLFASGRVKLSAVSLAVAVLYKQTVLAVLPVFMVALYRWSSKRNLVWFVSIFASILCILSLPYLALFPSLYLWALGFPWMPTPPPYMPEDLTVWQYDIVKPTNLGTVFGVLGQSLLALLLRQNLIYAIIAGFAALTVFLLRVQRLDLDDFLRCLLYSQLLFILLFPRGTYKYFFNSALPFFALGYGKKWDAFTFMALNIGLLILPRFLGPWYALVIMVFAYAMAKEDAAITSKS